MPTPIVGTAPSIVYDEVISFPACRSEDVLPQVNPPNPFGRFHAVVGGQIREDSFSRARLGYLNSTLAAGYSFRNQATGGMPCVQLGSAGIGRAVMGLEAMAAYIDPGDGSGPALTNGVQYNSVNRVWWLKWLMRNPQPNPDALNGLLLQPSNNKNNVRWPNDPVGVNNAGGFGFNADGAGQWQYVSYNRAGVLLQREAIALPAHTMADWNQFEIVIINSRFGIPATVEIWFNSSLVATRNWQGTDLEPYAAALNEYCFLPTIGGGVIAAGIGDQWFSEMECKKGRFTRAGVEV